jgi:hypothetical protein
MSRKHICLTNSSNFHIYTRGVCWQSMKTRLERSDQWKICYGCDLCSMRAQFPQLLGQGPWNRQVKSCRCWWFCLGPERPTSKPGILKRLSAMRAFSCPQGQIPGLDLCGSVPFPSFPPSRKTWWAGSTFSEVTFFDQDFQRSWEVATVRPGSSGSWNIISQAKPR